MDKSRVGAGGGSCGVTQAVNVARRHPEVKSLVLLAGPSDAGGRRYLLAECLAARIYLGRGGRSVRRRRRHRDAVALGAEWQSAQHLRRASRTAKHGTEIFGPHPELPKQIVAWYVDTLVKEPADPKTPVTAKRTPASEFWTALDSPGGVEKAAALFHEARQKDPNAYLFPENVLNLAGYERLQAGATKEAVAIFQLNVEAYPQSANAQDSLGDGYLADGQKDLALAAAKKCLEMLAADTGPEEFKKAIRASAEEKIAKLQ